MNALIRASALAAMALWTTLGTLSAGAATIAIDGTLDDIRLDDGTGIFAGANLNTRFLGFIDDATFSGLLGNGSNAAAFTCCIAAGGLEIVNDEVLDADSAARLNMLAGGNAYAEGNLIDSVNIEGDARTGTGGRIEIGVSYVFGSDTFADALPRNYPFDPGAVQLALFFIFEEDATGEEVFDGVGRLTTAPIPEPATHALWAAGMAILLVVGTHRQRRRAA